MQHYTRTGIRSFEGMLPCAKGQVRIKLSVADWDFLTYPIIQLVERPQFLPSLMPHIDVMGHLCYFAPGAVTLDRYQPEIAIAQCLNQVIALLDLIASNPDYRVKDIQNEFIAHWEAGQFIFTQPVFIGDIKPATESAQYFIITAGNKKHFMVASDDNEVTRFANALGLGKTHSKCRCWLLKTAAIPVVPEKMPQTVKELFAWLKTWDRNLSTAVQKILGKSDYLSNSFVTFAIDTPVGWLGFGFDLDYMRRIGYKRAPMKYRQFLHNKGGEQPLLRMAMQEVGARFVHSRNLSFPDLYNKRITIVGCGAIGSYVAQALIRLGAGTGKLGLLKLIDQDMIGPENLGRHILGYPALLQPKAKALADELLRQFPHSKLDAHSQSAFKHNALFAADLIIDATGEETVSEVLNHLRLKRGEKNPMLHIWIRGNGEAVQGLWTDSSGGGCYRCLIIPDDKHHRKERFELLKKAPEQHFRGCRAFTPYAVSAPMHAAALATDMVCAWLQGDPSPRFRTRSLETAEVFCVKNQNISKIVRCPACGQL